MIHGLDIFVSGVSDLPNVIGLSLGRSSALPSSTNSFPSRCKRASFGPRMPTTRHRLPCLSNSNTPGVELQNLCTSRWHGRTFHPLAQSHHRLLSASASSYTFATPDTPRAADTMARAKVAGASCRHDYTCPGRRTSSKGENTTAVLLRSRICALCETTVTTISPAVPFAAVDELLGTAEHTRQEQRSQTQSQWRNDQRGYEWRRCGVGR